MLGCQGIVKAYDTADYPYIIVVALLDNLVDVIGIPDVADLSGCLVMSLERDTVFLFEIDYNCIEFTVVAEFDRIIDIGTRTDIKSLYFEMFGSLNVRFGDLGEGAPVAVGKFRCRELLRVINNGLSISCALGSVRYQYGNADVGLLGINVFDDLGYPQSDQYDCEDSGNRKQDIKQLPELCQLRTVLILKSHIILIII